MCESNIQKVKMRFTAKMVSNFPRIAPIALKIVAMDSSHSSLPIRAEGTEETNEGISFLGSNGRLERSI